MISQPKKRKLNPMLLNVLFISGGLHALALLVLGSITVYKYIIPDDATFEEPPAVEEVEPPKQVTIEIKPQARPQPQAMQNLSMRQVGNIAVANVDMDLPSMEQSFTVSAGLGGFGGGSLLGGTRRGSIGIGMSDISVFGLKSRAERVLFAIDGSKSMLTDEKGGLRSYRIIKEEIAAMVSNLSAGTLFNVVFFDGPQLQFFKPQLVPAGAEVARELIDWMLPINADIKQLGLRNAKTVEFTTFPEDNFIQRNLAFRPHHRNNRSALLTQFLLEQSADAAYIITGEHQGFEYIFTELNARDQERYDRITNSEEYKKYFSDYMAERTEIKKLATAKKEAEDLDRIKRGLPPRVVTGDLGYEMGFEAKLEHPHEVFELSAVDTTEERAIRNYFRELIDARYYQKGRTPPTINLVLFLAGDEKFAYSQKLKEYTGLFKGDFRIIRGLNQIQNARSSSQTTN
jgi:hypothetical protein